MTYSIDFRKKVLAIKAQENLTLSAVSKRFGIGQASVVRWSKDIEPQRTRNKPTTKLNGETLAQDVEKQPDSYQYERAARFGVSQQGIAYALKQLKLSRKKNLPTSKGQSRGTIGFPSSNSQLSSTESTHCLCGGEWFCSGYATSIGIFTGWHEVFWETRLGEPKDVLTS